MDCEPQIVGHTRHQCVSDGQGATRGRLHPAAVGRVYGNHHSHVDPTCHLGISPPFDAQASWEADLGILPRQRGHAFPQRGARVAELGPPAGQVHPIGSPARTDGGYRGQPDALAGAASTYRSRGNVVRRRRLRRRRVDGGPVDGLPRHAPMGITTMGPNTAGGGACGHRDGSQDTKFGITASLVHSVQFIFHPPTHPRTRTLSN